MSSEPGRLKKKPFPVNIENPNTDQDFFAIGRLLLRNSTCLKTQTAALIADKNNKIISWGTNMCCPQGQLYGLPVSECPRMKAITGTQYDLCMPIHAEIVACINAFGISHIERKNLWHFPGFTLRLRRYEGFFKGAILYLVGHYWACEECTEFAKLLGIEEIKFDNLSGGDTLKKYRAQNLSDPKDAALDVSGCVLSGIVTVRIKPEKLAEFCSRHDINQDAVRPLLKEAKPDCADLFLVEVLQGAEEEKSLQFKNDPAVEDALVVFTKSA